MGGISGNATVEVVAYDAAGNLGKKTFTVYINNSISLNGTVNPSNITSVGCYNI